MECYYNSFQGTHQTLFFRRVILPGYRNKPPINQIPPDAAANSPAKHLFFTDPNSYNIVYGDIAMPANLTPQYLEAEQRYKRAVHPDEKLAALQEMMSLIPKHKGTEKLQAEIKRKIAQMRKETQKKGKAARRHDPSNIPREGAGRIVMVGPPNSGKSALLGALTNAQPEIAPWEFTTRLPEQGMIPWEDIQFQLIDIPAVSRQHMEYWLMNLVRSADLLFLVVDHSKPGTLEDIEEVDTILREHKIYMQRTDEDLPRGGVVIPAFLIVTKMDLPDGEENADVVEEFFGERFEILRISAQNGLNLESLKSRVFEKLSIVRVYSKMPGKPPESERPYVLDKGQTVEDLCRKVHNDFVDTLKFARIWGHGTYDGQRVTREYVLEDGDIIELHR
jgi:ribosome-interacting GTPase 1